MARRKAFGALWLALVMAASIACGGAQKQTLPPPEYEKPVLPPFPEPGGVDTAPPPAEPAEPAPSGQEEPGEGPAPAEDVAPAAEPSSSQTPGDPLPGGEAHPNPNPKSAPGGARTPVPGS